MIDGRPAIKWIIQLDPRGGELDPYIISRSTPLPCVVTLCNCLEIGTETQFKYRCKQVNLVQRTSVAGEEEFLFAAFSAFEVLDVAWNAGDDDSPHVVRLSAAVDNLKEAEDLPLAPWY